MELGTGWLAVPQRITIYLLLSWRPLELTVSSLLGVKRSFLEKGNTNAKGCFMRCLLSSSFPERFAGTGR